MTTVLTHHDNLIPAQSDKSERETQLERENEELKDEIRKKDQEVETLKEEIAQLQSQFRGMNLGN